jgi:transposase
MRRQNGMRGKPQAQPDFLTVVKLYECVPAEHPLRAIKAKLDTVLKKLSPEFDELYEELGRPSIPPEQLLKARVLTALYTVRSERLFCEQLGYNLLWLWFLDREFSEGSFNHSVFAKNYDRVLSADVAKLFFAEVYDLSREEGWTSDEHFTADGTLIESWASLKSFVRKDGADAAKIKSAKDEDPGNPTINFRGEQRCNDTHQSATDRDAVLYRKAQGKEARLCFGGHILMENRNGLCADFTMHNPIAESEPALAVKQMDAHEKEHKGVAVKTVGADKGYHRNDFITACRERNISPHVACKERVKLEGLDGRTTTRRGYQTSQRIRKRVEEIFGWIKTVGGLRRSRYRGLERTQAWGYFVAATYNLVRLAKLGQASAG